MVHATLSHPDNQHRILAHRNKVRLPHGEREFAAWQSSGWLSLKTMELIANGAFRSVPP
jgi:hypothetical protein